jgi:hypothetical protein
MRPWVLVALFSLGGLHAGETTDQMLAKDLDAYGKTWIYDDLAKGFKEAAASGKPLLVSIRCVP